MGKIKFQFDPHVLQLLFQRGWQIIAGGITVFIVPLALTATQQGYYFTFSSLIAMQVFFELGLNLVITQVAGHEAAKLIISDDGQISGNAESASKLLSLITLIRRWYCVSAPLFAVVLILVGVGFLGRQDALSIREWLGAWLLLVAFTAINLYLSPHLAILEGIGRVGQVARLRLHQSAVGMLLMWIGLVLGAGLWAVPLVSGSAALATWIWIRRYGQLSIPLDVIANSNATIEWRRDIFAMQWRIALSWLSGWIIFNSFTPMIFTHQGAVEAGKIGMAIAMFSAISTMSGSWANAATPKFTTYIALNKRSLMNQLFKQTVISGGVFSVFASLAVLCGVAAIKYMDLPFSGRIASLSVLTCLALVTVVNSFIFAAAVYMRAHKEEPMFWLSIVVGILTGIAAWFGSQYGTFEMTAIYAILVLFIALPWTMIIFRRYYNLGKNQ
ncbi:MAG: hypothetical protein B7X60_00595 [Polynucleobacter sp. 39-45-136]|jgi:hypothetical protein|nr:MAG: hypothetical protein B7X60_00595 [Polynucleobacter sp. 39-45-136]